MFSAYQPAMTLLFFRATPVGVYINSDQKKSQGSLRQTAEISGSREYKLSAFHFAHNENSARYFPLG